VIKQNNCNIYLKVKNHLFLEFSIHYFWTTVDSQVTEITENITVDGERGSTVQPKHPTHCQCERSMCQHLRFTEHIAQCPSTGKDFKGDSHQTITKSEKGILYCEERWRGEKKVQCILH
jgi:hypothetical protein